MTPATELRDALAHYERDPSAATAFQVVLAARHVRHSPAIAKLLGEVELAAHRFALSLTVANANDTTDEPVPSTERP